MTHEALGTVYLVGAGPGDPGLLTRRGAEILGRADVIVYDGLIHPLLLELAPRQAERIYAGKKHAPAGQPMTQSAINELLVARARAGQRVVRLKGGDAFVFGRGAEECLALSRAGIRFEVIPGVTSATAVPAYAGIPLTARDLASTVAFATGHEAAGKPSTDVDWEALARARTVVLFMALRTIADCCQRLVAAGKDPSTPAAAIYWGTTAAQRTVVATLGELPAATERAGLKPPVLVVVGQVVGLREALAWYETRPLFGVRVLVPRTIEQSRRAASLLAELGAEPVVLPVTRIEPPGDEAAALIEAAIADIETYDWVIFTSASAVTCFFAALDARARDARALGRARVASVGRATTEALRVAGVRADLTPARGDARAVAGAVIAAAGVRAAGMRVLLPRAAEGRDEGVVMLRDSGATVDVVPVYRTAPTPADDPALELGLSRLRAGAIDVLAAFAPSQVDALFTLLGADALDTLRACRVVAAIGGTTRAALTRRGLDVHVVASAPDAEVLVRDIAAHVAPARLAAWRSAPGAAIHDSKEP